MVKTERINVTLPKPLADEARLLIKKGIFSNFSELVRTGIRMEIRMKADVVQRRKILYELAQTVKRPVKNILKGKSTDTIVDHIRQQREELWEKEYAPYFG